MPQWLAQIAGFLLAKFANVFPNLVGVFSSIVSALTKEEAGALYSAILSDAAKHLLQAFIHKAKPAV
jgi:hypothetical protein